MLYKNLGSSNLNISRICLGTFQRRPINKQDFFNIVCYAYECGINFFDTADLYGEGQIEVWLGKALKNFNRDKTIIATKGGGKKGAKYANLSRLYIENAINNSLRRTRLDYIDLYQIHGPDPNTPIESTLEVISKYVENKKIKYAGFCNLSIENAVFLIKLIEKLEISFVKSFQIKFNYYDQTTFSNYIAFVDKTKYSILTYGLFGKYTNYSVIKKIFLDNDDTGNPHPSDLIRWALSYDEISSVIIGVSSINQLKENLSVC